jgi:hypothetical protein
MATVTAGHVPILTSGFVALLVGGLLVIAALNHFANR